MFNPGSLLMLVTTSIGAALWAADIESKRPTNPAQDLADGAPSAVKSTGGETVVSDGKKEL